MLAPVGVVKTTVLLLTAGAAGLGIVCAKSWDVEFGAGRDLANGLAAGVLLAASIVHMMPDADEALAATFGDMFPFANAISGCVFLLLMLVEEVALKFTRSPAEFGEPRAGGAGGSEKVAAPPAVKGEPILVIDEAPGSEVWSPCAEEPVLGVPLLKSNAAEKRAPGHLASRNTFRPFASVRELTRLLLPQSQCCVRRHTQDDDCRFTFADILEEGTSPPTVTAPLRSAFSEPKKPELDVHEGPRKEHDHSQGIVSAFAAEGTSATNALCLFAALSFHSLMEGLGLGSSQHVHQILSISCAILCHKGLAAFALGTALRESPSLSSWSFALLSAVFVAGTPLGGAIGWLAAASSTGWLAGVCNAAAAGTFLQIAAMELLPGALRSAKGNRLRVLFAVVLGYAAMSLLACWT